MAYQFTVRTAAATLGLALACALPAQAAGVPGQGTWQTTLLGRDLNRQEVAADAASAVYLYDTTLNVTWLRDASVKGLMDWTTATTWAADLTTGTDSKAVNDWRLPTMAGNPNANSTYSYDGSTVYGYNVPASSSEMASLFFNTLGNQSYLNTTGDVRAVYGLTNTGSFQNMKSYTYWFSTEYEATPDSAWGFKIEEGYQDAGFKSNQLYALAVRPGDVLAAVPEPETYMMLLLGLGAVGALSRRRARALGASAL